MDPTIINAKDLNISKIKIHEIKENKNGKGKGTFITYNNSKLYIRLPKMIAPFGISTYEDKAEGRISYSLDLSFGNDMTQTEIPDLKTALDFFEKLDQRVLEEACNNSFEYIGKPNAKKESVEDKYMQTLKYSTDKTTGERLEYPPRIKLTLHVDPKTNSSAFREKFFDQHKNPLEITPENCQELVPSRTAVYPIVEVNGIWVTRLGYGLRLNLLQARIKTQSFENRCLYGDISDEEAENTSAYNPLKRDADFEEVPVNKYARSDEDEVDYDEENDDKENAISV